MTGKLAIRCVGWRPVCRNTLRGFATIQIGELRMTMHEVAIHEKGGRAWAQLPSKPWLKDGRVVTDDAGKVQYSPLFEFDSAAVRTAFSDATIRAVLAFDPRALQCREMA